MLKKMVFIASLRKSRLHIRLLTTLAHAMFLMVREEKSFVAKIIKS